MYLQENSELLERQVVGPLDVDPPPLLHKVLELRLSRRHGTVRRMGRRQIRAMRMGAPNTRDARTRRRCCAGTALASHLRVRGALCEGRPILPPSTAAKRSGAESALRVRVKIMG
jgi:hypothetical protein